MLKRAACIATILWCSTAWPCIPAQLEPFTARGSTDRGLTLAVSDRGSVLKQGSEHVWKLPVSAFQVVFAPDDTWVAFAPNLDSTKLTIVGTRAKAPLFEIDLVSRLSSDERSFLTHTSCGLMWFQSWKPTRNGLQVVVTQNAQARPTQAVAAGITFLITPEGVVTRETAKLEIDLLKLAEQWTGPASDERAGKLAAISRLSSTETGRTQAAKLGPFIRRVYATADAQPFELDAAARLVGGLPPPDAKELIEVVLARPGWEAPLLWGMPRENPQATALATRVFKDASRSGFARAAAVRVATGDGSTEYGALLKAALTDKDPEVRGTAADNANRSKCTDALLTDVLAAHEKELAQPTRVQKNEWAHTQLVEHYQGAINRCLSDAKEPSAHARVAAAIERGVRFQPDQYSTPMIYLALVVWAEQAAPASVPSLLELTAQSCAAQKSDLGREPLNRVIQWRVLRAVKAGNLKEARAQLALFDSQSERLGVPELTVEDLGKAWSLPHRSEMVSQFIARMRAQVDPGKAAAKKKR